MQVTVLTGTVLHPAASFLQQFALAVRLCDRHSALPSLLNTSTTSAAGSCSSNGMAGLRRQNGTILPLSPPPTPPRHNKLSSLGLKMLYSQGHLPLSLMHLNPKKIASLTKYLSISTTSLTSGNKAQIHLVPSLRNPTPLAQASTINTLHRLGASTALPPASKLCHAYGHVNAQIIASMLSTIETELEDFLPELLASVGNNGKSSNSICSLTDVQQQDQAIGNADPSLVRKAYKHLSPLALHYVQAAEDFLSLILPADEFAYFYRREPTTFTQPTSKTKFHRCDAHLLTHLSSSPSALIGLRGIMLARATPDVLAAESRCPPLEMMEGFISGFGSQAPWMLSISGRIGWEMRVLRENSESASLGKVPIRPARPHGGAFLETRTRGLSVVGSSSSPGIEENALNVRYRTKPPIGLPLQMPVRISCVPTPLRIGGSRGGLARAGIAV
jgi:hypothetical protein